MSSMKEQYGDKEGERVFYATANKEKQKPMKSYKKGGVVQEDGPANLHAGEIVLPPKSMKPPTADDMAMSNDHLHDTVAFNGRHAVDHIARGLKAEKALKDRGITPRSGSLRDVIHSAMAEGSPAEEANETASEAAEEGDPVSARKRAQRTAAEAAVREPGLPKNFTKGKK